MGMLYTYDVHGALEHLLLGGSPWLSLLRTSYVLHPQLVIISSILERYYSVSTLAVSWTSMIYMVTYIPLIFPASWFLQKKVGIKNIQADEFGQIL